MSRERDSRGHRHQRDDQWDDLDYEQDDEYQYEAPPRRRMPPRQPYSRTTRSSSSLPVRSSSSSYRSSTNHHSYPSSPRKTYTHTLPHEVRQRRVWPFLLMGCAIGVVVTILALVIVVMTGIYSLHNGKLSIPVISPANQTISMDETQTIPLSMISQMVICDVVGNISVKADPTVSNPTLTITKKVQASSQAAADQEFQRMAVTIQPPQTLAGPLSCARLQQASATPEGTATIPPQTSNAASLATTTTDNTSSTLAINVSFPAKSSNMSADLMITLPPNVLPSTGPSARVNIETAGNISIDGISGILNIKGDSGNPQNSNDIKVTHAALANGSRLSTPGAIIFDGYLAQAADPNTTAFYILEGEKQVDVTLPSNTNVILDAYAVSGSINSQFPLQQSLLQKDKDMTSYHGPLNASASPPVNAQLTLHVGIGNVNIKQAQTPQI